MFDFFKDKEFLKRAFFIAIPVAIQSLINAGINLTDTLMVSTLDYASVAAVGCANNVFNLWNNCAFGIVSGAMILCSQFAGANKFSLVRKTFGLTLFVVIVFSQMFFIPCCFFPSKVLHVIATDQDVITAGIKYIRIACFSYPLLGVSLAIIGVLRSTGRVKITVVSSLVALFMNIICNFTLINGHFGAPALGVVGAGVATIMSRLAECIILIVAPFVLKSRLVANLRDIVSFFQKDLIKLYAKTVSETAIDEIIYGFGFSLYFVAYGRLPAEQLSAISLTYVLYNLLITFAIGFGAASSTILGNELGANNIKTAKKYATYFIKLLFSILTIISILAFMGKGFYENLYANLGPTVLYYLDRCLIVLIITNFFGSASYLFLVGILRSGGDLRSTIYIDILTCWCIGVPLAFLAVLVWHLPIYLAFALVGFEELTKSLFGYIRYKQNKWANNIVKNIN